MSKVVSIGIKRAKTPTEMSAFISQELGQNISRIRSAIALVMCDINGSTCYSSEEKRCLLFSLHGELNSLMAQVNNSIDD